MISYLSGTLVYKGETTSNGAVFEVEVNGVGYRVLTSTASLLQAPPLNTPVKIYTSLLVREDSIQLVGFMNRDEQELFDILGTASGVGAKVALALLSGMSTTDLSGAIMAGDHKRLTTAKGVGPKLAQKLAIELKEKVAKWRDERLTQQTIQSFEHGVQATEAILEAESVLLSLGYSPVEIHEGLQSVQKAGKHAEYLTSEEILQQALKWLATV
jgi:holliday junction DNA helicase RuvA